MDSVSYKCPNCGAGMKYDPASQKFKCEYCMAEFSELQMAQFEQEHATAKAADPEFNPEAAKEGALVYTCPSCGAEIVTDETTAATFCYYCHNPVVLAGKLSGEFLPNYVVPFEIDKNKAIEMFEAWIGKKKFVPDAFYSKDQIEKFSGVYFPYWMYSCTVKGRMQAEGEKNRIWTTGNIQYTEHKRYQIAREGELDVKNVTRNALSKSNHELVEGVLPFQMEKLKPFTMQYLSGFQAEKRDMDNQVYREEVEKEVRDYTVQNLRQSVNGFSQVNVKNSETAIVNPRWRYALMPVWTLTYQDRIRNKTYYFAMNGQNGKICGKLPVDKKKLAFLFASVFVPVFAILLIGGWFL